MDSNYVYISSRYSDEAKSYIDFIDSFEGFNADYSSVYSEYLMSISNIIVLVLPNNRFSYFISRLPTNMRSELSKALELKKSVYITYSSMEGLGVYPTEISEDLITGISGSRNSLFKSSLQKSTKKMVNSVLEKISKEESSVVKSKLNLLLIKRKL